MSCRNWFAIVFLFSLMGQPFAQDEAPEEKKEEKKEQEESRPAKKKVWKVEDSIAYLLKHQKEDGTWDIGLQVNPDTGMGVTVGTTAIAGMALLTYFDKEPKKLKSAINKAATVCKWKAWRLVTGARDFESIAWGQLYTLHLMARLSKHVGWSEEERAAWKAEVPRLLKWFYKRQNGGGGWGYRASFHSAAGLLLLQELDSLGFEVDEEKMGKCIEFMGKMRTEKGYRYSGGVSKEKHMEQEEGDAWNDGAGRIGCSALALFKANIIKKEDVESELEKFFEVRDFLWMTREATKEGKWHRRAGASPYAYFAFFGYYYTAKALQVASKDKQKMWAGIMREDLLKNMEENSTWINIPVSFKATGQQLASGTASNVAPGSRIYSTSMAIMAMKELGAKTY